MSSLMCQRGTHISQIAMKLQRFNRMHFLIALLILLLAVTKVAVVLVVLQTNDLDISLMF